MNFGLTLRRLRRRAGLSQRALAAKTGVAQPTIARLETGADTPRLDTAARLLEACGWSFAAVPLSQIDMSLVRELRAMPPIERVSLLVEEAAALDLVDGAVRR